VAGGELQVKTNEKGTVTMTVDYTKRNGLFGVTIKSAAPKGLYEVDLPSGAYFAGWYKNTAIGHNAKVTSDNQHTLSMSQLLHHLVETYMPRHVGDVPDDPDDYRAYIKMLDGQLFIRAVYGYAHGSLEISTTPYGDRFDSGVVGFIYVVRKQAMAEDLSEAMLAENVRTLNAYLNNEVYDVTAQYTPTQRPVVEYHEVIGYAAAEVLAENALNEAVLMEEQYVASLRMVTTQHTTIERVAHVAGYLNGNTYISYGFDCTIMVLGPPDTDAHTNIVSELVRKLNTVSAA
jgi:hypothetical protein